MKDPNLKEEVNAVFWKHLIQSKNIYHNGIKTKNVVILAF